MIHSDVQRDRIPNLPWIYLFHQKRRGVLYIGKAKSIKKRLQQYFTPSSVRKQDMVAKAHTISFYTVASDQEAILLETQLINTHKPPFNNLIKGDTSYAYIKIPREPFPNIHVTRYKYHDKARYIGPKIRKKSLKWLMRMMRWLLQWRQCSPQQFNQGVVCTDYFFQQCAWWCVYNTFSDLPPDSNAASPPLSSQPSPFTQLPHSSHWSFHHKLPHRGKEGIFHHHHTTKKEASKHYTMLLSLFIDFLEGKSSAIVQYIQKEIDTAIAAQHFEWAAKLRDMLYTLQEWEQKQDIHLPTQFSWYFATATPLAQWVLLVILKLYEGKLVDIITQIYSQDDGDWDGDGDGDWVIIHAKNDREQILIREYSIIHHPYADQASTQVYRSASQKLNQELVSILYNHTIQFGDSYLQSTVIDTKESRTFLLWALQETYKLLSIPERIECVDISHFSWEAPSGGLSCLVHGYIYTRWYRNYTITQANTQDDRASLAELFVRRFGCGKTQKPNDLPHLFILDGGEQHLALVPEIMQLFADDQTLFSSVQFASIGKGKARKRWWKQAWHQEIFYVLRPRLIHGTLTWYAIDAYPLDPTAPNRLLIQCRDEAHRFANRHRQRTMDKQRKK